MNKVGKALLVALGATSIALSPSVFATNGYFTHGNGTKNKGMAGAGIAMPEEAMAISNNPASALLVEDSVQAGAAVFNPNRSYTAGPSQANGFGGAFTIKPGTLDSAREYFVIPHVAITKHLSEDSAWGAAFYGRGGMNTRWEGGAALYDPSGQAGTPGEFPGTYGATAFGGTSRVGIDLSQAFLDLSYARKLSDGLTVGIGLVAAYQMFEAVGLEAFTGYTETFANSLFSNGFDQQAAFGSVSGLTGNGHDGSFGFGAKLGVNASLSDHVSFAAMYQTKIDMSEFDDYSDLFAEGGDFDIPANVKAGFTVKANDSLSFSVDIDHTWFSDVDAVGNGIANLFSCPTANGFTDTTSNTGCLGGATGAGFGWDDMTVFKVGMQWGNPDAMTWRAGFSQGAQPIPSSEILFNIMAPATIEDHVTFGFTKAMGNNREINFAFMHALSNTVTGQNSFDPTQTIELEMDQNELELGYTWKF